MGSLGAACKESYGRAYPYIARLQILSELEDGLDLLSIDDESHGASATSNNSSAISSTNNNNNINCNRYDSSSNGHNVNISIPYNNKADIRRRRYEMKKWDQRMSLMSTSCSSFVMTLAARRSILSITNMNSQVAENWLYLCRAMRKKGRFEAARYALRQAEQTGLYSNNNNTNSNSNSNKDPTTSQEMSIGL